VDGIRDALYRWMDGVLQGRGWTAAAWARTAGVTPTNLTRFLKDPANASLPSAETIGKLAWAAGSEPRFLPFRNREEPGPRRVPVLTVSQLRYGMEMAPDGRAVYLRGLARTGAPVLTVDGTVTACAFALRLTSLHMNAGGLLPEDHVVLEPPAELAPEEGDLVVTLDGDGVCGYRHYPPLLVPVSTDSACRPRPLEGAHLVGVAVQMVRTLRRAG